MLFDDYIIQLIIVQLFQILKLLSIPHIQLRNKSVLDIHDNSLTVVKHRVLLNLILQRREIVLLQHHLSHIIAFFLNFDKFKVEHLATEDKGRLVLLEVQVVLEVEPFHLLVPIEVLRVFL